MSVCPGCPETLWEGIISQGQSLCTHQPPFPVTPSSIQTQRATIPAKGPRPMKAPPSHPGDDALLRATGILQEGRRKRTCSSCPFLLGGGGRRTQVWQLGAQPSGQPGGGRLSFTIPLSSHSGHWAVEAGVWCFSISRQVSVARPWLALSPPPPAQPGVR